MKQEVYKLEIFLPESHFDAVREALWSVDAGHIGAYDRCMSWSRVHSCWRPLEGTDPFLGTPGEVCRAEELKSRSAAGGSGSGRPWPPSGRPTPMRSR